MKMPTSAAEAPVGALTHLVFTDGAWLLLDEAGVIGSGETGESPFEPPARTILAVPGEDVAVHWIALDSEVTPAQAAAAARLALADSVAGPVSQAHVAVGVAEAGLTPVAFVSSELMRDWLAALPAGCEPDAIIPTPMLIAPPNEGFFRRDRGPVSDFRGAAAAWSMEPDLAGALTGDAAVVTIDGPAFEAGLPAILAAPPLDLRQGAFARRRRIILARDRARRIAGLVMALLILTLVVQIANILSYSFAADRLRAEADALVSAAPAGGTDRSPGFSAAASVLFDAVRATPGVEVSRLDYRRDGSLGATIMTGDAASLDALRGRIEAGGLRVEAGNRRSAGGRPAIDLVMRGA